MAGKRAKAIQRTTNKEAPTSSINKEAPTSFVKFHHHGGLICGLLTAFLVHTLLPRLLQQQGKPSWPVPPTPNASNFQPIGDGVYSAQQFLSVDEVKYILDFAESEQAGGWKPSPTGGKAFASPSGPSYLEALRKDPVIRRIEERIANATGVPIHPHEDVLSLARIHDRATSAVRGKNFLPFGLHLDTDTRPHRVATVLVYLKTPSQGGLTVFPLLNTTRRFASFEGTRKTTLQQRHKELEEALEAQISGPPRWNRQAQTPNPEENHPLLDLLEEACRGTYGLAPRLEAGMALLWFQVDGNGKEDRSKWHEGCNVVSGTKVTLQKFKELPIEQRTMPGTTGAVYTPFITSSSNKAAGL